MRPPFDWLRFLMRYNELLTRNLLRHRDTVTEHEVLLRHRKTRAAETLANRSIGVEIKSTAPSEYPFMCMSVW